MVYIMPTMQGNSKSEAIASMQSSKRKSFSAGYMSDMLFVWMKVRFSSRELYVLHRNITSSMKYLKLSNLDRDRQLAGVREKAFGV